MDEQVLAEGGAFHRSCFKCAKCAGQLTLLTFAAYNGKVFCKPHLKELFLREWQRTLQGSRAELTRGTGRELVLPP